MVIAIAGLLLELLAAGIGKIIYEGNLAACAANLKGTADGALPDMHGLQVTTRLRQWSRTPVIVLSTRGQEKDKVAALDAGAIDYLTKPFGIQELLARIRVVLRHQGANHETVFSVGKLKVDLTTRHVTLADKEIHLTPIEHRLLTTLARHAGKVLTHDFLLNEVWGPSSAHESHYLRIYMGYLRRKVEPDPVRPRYLLTEQGVAQVPQEDRRPNARRPGPPPDR